MRLYHPFLLLFLFISPALATDVTLPLAPLDIKTSDKVLHFMVEVATTEKQHKRGLMFRTKLPEMHGMIFVFHKAMHVEFWMKNTLIPLDMLFIDNAGVITQIVENAPVKSTDPIPSLHDTRAVIEVIGGTVSRYHLSTGDKVIYPLFTP